MSGAQGSCPACGGPIQFTIASAIVTVCPYCKSAVARGDKRLEDLGKVADLTETDSPLELGVTGKVKGVGFRLAGRAQMGHPAGGVWDEWYAYFDNKRWGWIAEAQGRFYLTFPQEKIEGEIPAFDELHVDLPVAAVDNLRVTELGSGTMLAAQGEIPYLLTPGETFQFADLAGQGRRFGTLDYSQSPPAVYRGYELTLDELGIPKTARKQPKQGKQVGTLQLNCPKCGGPLALHAPDKSERVTCPNCRSLLDVEGSDLKFFKALKPFALDPVLKLGAAATLFGANYTVIGFMQRMVEFEGVPYYWEEYLLYQRLVGFRWLVFSEYHWSFVEPLPPGEVKTVGGRAVYEGASFKKYNSDTAHVTAVLGEFYWKVAQGERTYTEDYIRPPRMLSREVTTNPDGPKGKKSAEVNWSLGTYVKRSVIEEAFKLDPLPRPQSVGPHQPFPHKAVYGHWWKLAAAIFVLGLLLQLTASRKTVFDKTYNLGARTPSVPVRPPLARAGTGAAAAKSPPISKATPAKALTPEKPATDPAGGESDDVYFTDSFELSPRRNVRITATANNLNNAWVAVVGDLIQADTDQVQPFDVGVEYYSGVDGGEKWSEGSRQRSVDPSAQPHGQYTMRLEFEREKPMQPATVRVKVDQDVPRLLYWGLALLAVSIVPLFVMIRHIFFDMRRWANSAHSPYQSSGDWGSDDDD